MSDSIHTFLEIQILVWPKIHNMMWLQSPLLQSMENITVSGIAAAHYKYYVFGSFLLKHFVLYLIHACMQ